MLGRRSEGQQEFAVGGTLEDLIAPDYILRRVDRVLDLSWLRNAVADLYCTDNGRPGIDPEVAVRLMLAGLLLGIVHDRRLMREAQVNLAIRWFAGYALHEALPDHSSLTRIRQRWGAERFKAILSRTVEACVAAKIATGEVVHLDATLIRADVSWGAMVDAHADAVLAGGDETQASGLQQTGVLLQADLCDASAGPIRMHRWAKAGAPRAWSPPTSSTRRWTRCEAWCSTWR